MSRDDWRGLIDFDAAKGCAGAVACLVRAGTRHRLIIPFGADRDWRSKALNTRTISIAAGDAYRDICIGTRVDCGHRSMTANRFVVCDSRGCLVDFDAA